MPSINVYVYLIMIKDHSLYLVTGQDSSRGRSTLQVVKEALAGGIDIVQMREKTFARDELVELGSKLSKLCMDSGATFIVNDDPFLALETGAGGVHLGQEDLIKYPAGSVREIIGNDGIIGVSTHSFDQFEEADGMDIDYIAYGPVFKTKTKDYFIGIENINRIMEKAKKPVVFIGGIDLENIKEVLDRGGRNIALIRGITEAEDIAFTVKELKDIIMARKENGGIYLNKRARFSGQARE